MCLWQILQRRLALFFLLAPSTCIYANNRELDNLASLRNWFSLYDVSTKSGWTRWRKFLSVDKWILWINWFATFPRDILNTSNCLPALFSVNLLAKKQSVKITPSNVENILCHQIWVVQLSSKQREPCRKWLCISTALKCR